MTSFSVTATVVAGAQSYTSPPVTATVNASAWPDATNTGPNPALTLVQVPAQATSGTGWNYSGGMIHILTPGTKLVGLDVQGGVANKLSGGTPYSATDCRFRLTGWSDGSVGVQLSGGTFLRCEIGGGADGQTLVRSLLTSAYGTSAAPITFDSCNIHHGLHGIHNGGYVTVINTWIHDMAMGQAYNNGATPNPNDHTDGDFLDTGHFIVYRHNRIQGGNQAGLFVQNYAKTAEGTGDLSLDGNWFQTDTTDEGVAYGGPPNYGLDIENKRINGPVTVTNNVFDRTPWGQGFGQVPALGSNGQTITVTGNTFADNGASCDSLFHFQSVQYP